MALKSQVCPRDFQLNQILSLEAHLDCFRPEPSLKEILRQRNPDTVRWRMRHGYPQNHLRNLARKACQVSPRSRSRSRSHCKLKVWQ